MSTARLTTYCAAVLESAAIRKGMGGLDSPVGDVEFTYLADTYTRRFVQTENSAGLFVGTATATRFQFLAFRIIGAGTLWVSELHDKPTSSSDYTPLGTQRRWHHSQWTCKMGWRMWNTDLVIGHDTAATEYADNAGLPGLWTTSIDAVVTKKVYAVYLYNSSSADPVEIESLLVLTT